MTALSFLRGCVLSLSDTSPAIVQRPSTGRRSPSRRGKDMEVTQNYDKQL